MGKYIIGIDPGLGGAFCLIDPEGVILKLELAPTMKITKSKKQFNLVSMINMFEKVKMHHPTVWIEKVASRPNQSAPATFNFGKGYGFWEMLCAVYQYPMYEITPAVWKKRMVPGTDGGKGASILKAQQLYPTANLLATERSKVPNDGLAEALLIATYGRLYG